MVGVQSIVLRGSRHIDSRRGRGRVDVITGPGAQGFYGLELRVWDAAFDLMRVRFRKPICGYLIGFEI